ncbi:hypothetical protein [Congregibacter sp.]|uniref:hypothetical protein n=1 Tax=Congregibacter sp. TaxID=2744308 RepID=UPI00385EA454
MRKVLIHIGRHKTGTTAIQNFLQDNRESLRELGYVVPQSGRVKDAHHEFARPFQPRNAQQLEGVDDYRQLKPFKSLKTELALHDADSTAVISSEGFQNSKPKMVRAGFKDYQAQIVVYLRSQLEYLASSYAQRVHATQYTGTLQDFYRDVYQTGNHYASFLENWSEFFPNQLVVRRYRSTNVVEDFASSVLKVPVAHFRLRNAHSNPSLNSVVTLFKCELNRRKPANMPPQLQIYPVLPKLNALFPAPKFTLPPEIVSDLVESSRESDNEVAKTYFGEQQLFDYSRFPTHPESSIRDIQFETMYSALLKLLEVTDATTG